VHHDFLDFLEQKLSQQPDYSIARNAQISPKSAIKAKARARLLALRAAIAGDATAHAALNAQLKTLFAYYAPHCVGFYWPLPGEFDLRAHMATWLAQNAGRRAALPVIRARHAPLEFHRWAPDAPMREGLHQIPEPVDGERLTPDLLLIPCVGFDTHGYRLGYGGGYYDRTLAAWPARALPVTVGIACEICRMAALPHEAHDWPMNAVVTQAGWYRCAGAE
jgi:5,10-methenyltetrahydrofolate synthetase